MRPWLLLTVSLACATSAPSTARGPVAIAQPIPDIAYQDLRTGETRTLSALRGKVVLLDIWASWCAPCKEELPELDGIARRLGDDVVILAVSLDEDRQAALDFLNRQKSWKIVFGHDGAGRVGDWLAPPKMPTSYVIDRDGIVRHINEGYNRGDAARIEDWLRQQMVRQ